MRTTILVVLAALALSGCGEDECRPSTQVIYKIDDPVMGIECIGADDVLRYSYNHTVPNEVPEDVSCIWYRASYTNNSEPSRSCDDAKVYAQFHCDRPNVGCQLLGVVCYPPEGECR